jgi:hypothetical protein
VWSSKRARRAGRTALRDNLCSGWHLPQGQDSAGPASCWLGVCWLVHAIVIEHRNEEETSILVNTIPSLCQQGNRQHVARLRVRSTKYRVSGWNSCRLISPNLSHRQKDAASNSPALLRLPKRVSVLIGGRVSEKSAFVSKKKCKKKRFSACDEDFRKSAQGDEGHTSRQPCTRIHLSGPTQTRPEATAI